MYASPFVTQRVAEQHQRNLRAAAERSRLGKHVCSTTVVDTNAHSERIAPMQTLQTLVLSFLLNPRAITVTGAAIALVASVVLGTESASALGVIHGGR